MKWTEQLSEQGYDMINGVIRSQRLGQLWVQRGHEEPQLYYQELEHAFTAAVELKAQSDSALDLNSSRSAEYGFNIGLTLLEGLMEAIGLSRLSLSSKLGTGKKLSIRYENAECQSFPLGEVDAYLSHADFRHPNPVLLRMLNRNDLLLITGVITAKNIRVEMETEALVKSEVVTKLNKAASGKLEFKKGRDRKVRMSSTGKDAFPVAVQAHRLQFARGQFRGLKLVTDADLF